MEVLIQPLRLICQLEFGDIGTVAQQNKISTAFVLQNVSAGHQPIFGLAGHVWIGCSLAFAKRSGEQGLLEHAGPRGPGAGHETRPTQGSDELYYQDTDME